MNQRTSSPATIKVIAAALGLSHSTVSRALNGRPGINSETRERILAEAAEQGYVPNGAAQTLKQRSSSIVGLVVPNIRNRFYAGVAKTMADAASEQARQVMLFTTDDDPRRETQSIRSLVSARAQAIVIAATAQPEPESLSLLRKLRVIQLLRKHSKIKGPVVEVDDTLGIDLATSALLRHDHRRIAYIGARTDLSTGRHRLDGFRAAIGRAGLAVDEDMVELRSPRVAEGLDALAMVLRHRPTGLVVGSPELAEGAVTGIVRRGIAVPDDLSVVCYGDRGWHELVFGGLTAVRLPEEDLARTALALLFPSSQGAPAADVRLQPTLVMRASVAAPSG